MEAGGACPGPRERKPDIGGLHAKEALFMEGIVTD